MPPPKPANDKPATPVHLKALWPEVWALMKPRRPQLALGAGLMVINRVCGLALPVSTKFLPRLRHGQNETRQTN